MHSRKYGQGLASCKVAWFSQHFNCRRLKSIIFYCGTETKPKIASHHMLSNMRWQIFKRPNGHWPSVPYFDIVLSCRAHHRRSLLLLMLLLLLFILHLGCAAIMQVSLVRWQRLLNVTDRCTEMVPRWRAVTASTWKKLDMGFNSWVILVTDWV